ncbi:hypothetical protein BJY52DRAFT_1189069 [Lactarius psammicola]|nr:hypothetical protein BJY52DRAFT_1189069 [Lactarius psammicola]
MNQSKSYNNDLLTLSARLTANLITIVYNQNLPLDNDDAEEDHGEEEDKPEDCEDKLIENQNYGAENRNRLRTLHSEGKTDRAKAGLSRLAKIRAEREAAAVKRKAEAEVKHLKGLNLPPPHPKKWR